MRVFPQSVQAQWELLRIDEPVAKSGAIRIAFAKPAVIDDEALHPEACGLPGERFLICHIHVESGRIPGVVQNGPRTKAGGIRQNLCAFKSMQQTRRTANAAIGITGIKRRRSERFPGRQVVSEIKRVVSPGDSNLFEGSLLHVDAPVSAPAMCAEPGTAVLRIVVARVVERKPWIRIIARTFRCDSPRCVIRDG